MAQVFTMSSQPRPEAIARTAEGAPLARDGDRCTCGRGHFIRPPLSERANSAPLTLEDATTREFKLSSHARAGSYISRSTQASATNAGGGARDYSGAQRALDTLRSPSQSVGHGSSSRRKWLTGLALALTTLGLSLGLPAEPKDRAKMESALASSLPAASPPTTNTHLPLPQNADQVRSVPSATLPPFDKAAAHPRARLVLDGFRLHVTANPTVQVLVDGRPAGFTPRTIVRLGPGAHRILLVNRKLKLRAQTTVRGAASAHRQQDLVLE